MVSLVAVAIALAGTMCSAAGGFYLKKASKAFNLNILKQLKNYRLFIGLGLFAISTLCYLVSVKIERLSAIYPFTSASYIWVALISMTVLKEKMSAAKWAGIALVIAGIIVASVAQN